jgi:PKD repeat protein
MEAGPMKARSIWAFLAFAVFAAFPAWGDTTYNGGRAGGVLQLSSGDSILFAPGTNPTPNALWIGVVGGGGATLIRDGAGRQTSSFTLNTGDVLLFLTTPPYFLNFQGGSLTLFYGGTVMNKPPGPVCGTGAQGPVLLMVNKAMNFNVESGVSGPPQLSLTSYASTTPKRNGDLDYYQMGTYQNVGTKNIPACSGSDCCSPSETLFALKNLSGGNFTIYEANSTGPSNFDWNADVPSPLTCTASASPTSGMAPLEVKFTAGAAGGSSGYKWEWKFGDGGTSTKQNPSYTYPKGGTFTWKATVEDNAKNTCVKTGTIAVTGALAVTATVLPRQGVPPLTAAFSTAVNGGTAPYTYLWNFADGGTSNLANPTHTFVAAGAYDCDVTVTDHQHRSAAALASVYVGVPIPPSIVTIKSLTNPFRLKMTGADFMNGCGVTIDGTPAPEVAFKDPSTLVVKGGSTLKALVPKGVPVCVHVINPDGGESECFTYQR